MKKDQKRADGRSETVAVFVDHLIETVPELTAKDRARICSSVGAALDSGVTVKQVADAIAFRTLDGAQNPVLVVESRIRALEPPRPSQPAAHTCKALGHGTEPWNTCRACKGDLMAGDDPYRGVEHLRPAGWADVFGPRAKALLARVMAAAE
jgi:hypothetical protein